MQTDMIELRFLKVKRPPHGESERRSRAIADRRRLTVRRRARGALTGLACVKARSNRPSLRQTAQ